MKSILSILFVALAFASFAHDAAPPEPSKFGELSRPVTILV